LTIKKGNDELTNVINEAIDAMIKDGTLKELSNKYFGVDITN
jgi:Bacterial extracellular solute-binding proteins, family 3.